MIQVTTDPRLCFILTTFSSHLFLLQGQSNDDTFIVRSFIALEITENGEEVRPDLGKLTLIGDEGVDEFDIRGDFDNVATDPEEYSPQGEDPDYIMNSQVDVDGGTGDDRLVVVGTEGDDKYVVTEGRVYGGGLVSLTRVVKTYPNC